VVVKTAPPTPFLSIRERFEDMAQAFAAVGAVAEAGSRQIRPGVRDNLMVLAHADSEDDPLDLEIGFSLTRPSNARVTIAGGQVLRASELPAVSRMATVVRHGPPYESHKAFSVLGGWMEAHGCAVAGPCREVFLEPLTANQSDVLVEIQFPVRDAA
jgi:effector-binding domain-containing protein